MKVRWEGFLISRAAAESRASEGLGGTGRDVLRATRLAAAAVLNHRILLTKLNPKHVAEQQLATEKASQLNT